MYHPTRLRDLPSQVSFRPIRGGTRFDCGGFQVEGVRLNHPGGSLGYRIWADGQSIAYITDTAPFARPGEGVVAGEEPTDAEARVIAFLEECDVVIYDTMYDLEEYLEKMTWGHSYPEYAQAICKAAGVKHLVLFHHLPDASDDSLDALEQQWASATEPTVSLAKEGASVQARAE